MGLMDVLKNYIGPPSGSVNADAADHFGQVAQQVPQSTLSQGLADAFRSNQTPPFGDMVARLFGNSDPHQRAGLLTQLISGGDLGSANGGTLGSGPLDRLLRQVGIGGAVITPDQAAEISTNDVQQVAARAEQENPGIVERVSDFYAQHPTLVQTLGSAALSIALSTIARART